MRMSRRMGGGTFDTSLTTNDYTFTKSGASPVSVYTNQGSGKWVLELQDDGTLTITKNAFVDIYLIGGGAAGYSSPGIAQQSSADAAYGYQVYNGGNGGRGGWITIAKMVLLIAGSYTAVIGKGGYWTQGGQYSWSRNNATATTFAGLTAYGGDSNSSGLGGAAGGAGAKYVAGSIKNQTYNTVCAPANGTTSSTYDFLGHNYGGGGAGGGLCFYSSGVPSSAYEAVGTGGATGGGSSAMYGQGGGATAYGGGGSGSGRTNYNAGAGYKGLIQIRSAR